MTDERDDWREDLEMTPGQYAACAGGQLDTFERLVDDPHALGFTPTWVAGGPDELRREADSVHLRAIAYALVAIALHLTWDRP